MRHKICTLTAILLLGLTVMASAQNEAEMEAARQRAAQRAMMRSPAFQQAQRNSVKQVMNFSWNSNLMAVGMLLQDDFREGIGVTPEQHQKIQEAMQINAVNDPETRAWQEEMRKIMTETPGGPFGENGSEEMQQRFIELQINMQNKMQEAMFERMTNVVNENLTADQLKKVKESQISMMGEFPIISPDMFEVLDLSETQKQQLGGIKKELEPEFERQVDKTTDLQMKFTEKIQDELEKLEGITDPEERRKRLESIVEKVRKANPEIHREMNEVMESGKILSNRLKFRMFDVLTDEQMERIAQLVDNPPDYVKKMIAETRKRMGNDGPQPAADGEWRPGPNSWKPGDPIPAEYIEQRRARFPRRNQQDNER